MSFAAASVPFLGAEQVVVKLPRVVKQRQLNRSANLPICKLKRDSLLKLPKP
jgi:hypothetical protein